MRNFSKIRRGFTVAELAVVLAVTAIAATMVVSFTTLVSHRRAVSQQKLDAYTEIRLVEALVENYIEKPENSDAESITISNGALSINDKITLERVTKIDIKKSESIENSEITIYYCTVTYEVASSEETYTFCVLKGGS